MLPAVVSMVAYKPGARFAAAFVGIARAGERRAESMATAPTAANRKGKRMDNTSSFERGLDKRQMTNACQPWTTTGGSRPATEIVVCGAASGVTLSSSPK